MSRLLSAWNQKFELQYDGLNQYLQYVKKIVRFERPEYEKNNHLVSLEAFSDYVAHLEDDNAYNEHWKRFVTFGHFFQMFDSNFFPIILKKEFWNLDLKFFSVTGIVAHHVL